MDFLLSVVQHLSPNRPFQMQALKQGHFPISWRIHPPLPSCMPRTPAPTTRSLGGFSLPYPLIWQIEQQLIVTIHAIRSQGMTSSTRPAWLKASIKPAR